MALTDKLTAIANAIREKTGGTELLTLDQMPTEIAGIETGGGVDISPYSYLVAGTYVPAEDMTNTIKLPGVEIPSYWTDTVGKILLAISPDPASSSENYIKIAVENGTTRIIRTESGSTDKYYPLLKKSGLISIGSNKLRAGQTYKYIFARMGD
jgi:hypothetical protein